MMMSMIIIIIIIRDILIVELMKFYMIIGIMIMVIIGVHKPSIN